METTAEYSLSFLQAALGRSTEERLQGMGTAFTARQCGFKNHDELAEAVERRKKLDTPKSVRAVQAASQEKAQKAAADLEAAENEQREAEALANLVFQTNRELEKVGVVLGELLEIEAGLGDQEKWLQEKLTSFDHTSMMYSKDFIGGYAIQQDRAYRQQLTQTAQDRIIIPLRIATIRKHIAELKGKLPK